MCSRRVVCAENAARRAARVRAAEAHRLLRRTVVARVGFGALCLLIVAGSYAFATGWEVAGAPLVGGRCAASEALASAHASAVHLVSRTLALQSALDAQEDLDRAMLQTRLKLERERLRAALAKSSSARSTAVRRACATR